MEKTRNFDEMNRTPEGIIYSQGYAPEIVIRDFGVEGINVSIDESWQHSLNINLNRRSVEILHNALGEWLDPAAESKAKAWKDVEDTLTAFDALPEAEREEMLHDIDRRNFETVERVELERLRSIEARAKEKQAEKQIHKSLRGQMQTAMLKYILEGKSEDGSGDDE